ncbi:MAG TPA: hypothetical protein VHP83_11645 [Aggregatilineaceae bacterium]|nr:hypothetical protein [Aggregatilineaceae bacterium]
MKCSIRPSPDIASSHGAFESNKRTHLIQLRPFVKLSFYLTVCAVVPAARQLHYFGYKLVMLTTLDGIYDLVPANWEERDAAEVLLHRIQDCDIFGDKGFLGQAWQAEIQTATGNRIWTVKRTNQADQNPSDFDQLLRVVSKNWCNSRFLPSRGVAVVVVDDPTQHRATTQGPGVGVGEL